MLWHCLKLSTGVPALGHPRRFRPRSGSACARPRATQHELQRNLLMVATCVRLGGAWERQSCEPRPAIVTLDLGPRGIRYAEIQCCLFESF